MKTIQAIINKILAEQQKPIRAEAVRITYEPYTGTFQALPLSEIEAEKERLARLRQTPITERQEWEYPQYYDWYYPSYEEIFKPVGITASELEKELGRIPTEVWTPPKETYEAARRLLGEKAEEIRKEIEPRLQTWTLREEAYRLPLHLLTYRGETPLDIARKQIEEYNRQILQQKQVAEQLLSQLTSEDVIDAMARAVYTTYAGDLLNTVKGLYERVYQAYGYSGLPAEAAQGFLESQQRLQEQIRTAKEYLENLSGVLQRIWGIHTDLAGLIGALYERVSVSSSRT